MKFNLFFIYLNNLIQKKQLTTLQVFAKLFSAVGLSYYLFRLLDWKILFSPESIIDKNYVMTHYREFFQPLFYFFPESQTLAFAMYFFVMLVFAFSIFRPCYLVFKIVAWLFHIMFFYRNLPGVYGGDLVLNAFFIFYVFSEVKNMQIQNLLVRAAQVQVIMIYLASGVSKLQGKTWIEGSAVGIITANEFFTLFTINLLENLPVVSALITWTILIFEVGSPFGFMVSKTRKIWLIFGVIFHIGIAVYMGLWFFSLKMLATYVFFSDYSSSPSEPMASTGQPSRAS